MGQLGFCARIFRNVCTFLITCKSSCGVDRICRPIGAWGNDRPLSSARRPSLPVRYLLVIRLLSGLASTRCRSPSYGVACPLGMVQVILAVVRLPTRSRIRSASCGLLPVGVAPFDAALPGYSFHRCFFMSTQPLSRKVTPSSVSSARWSGKLGASRPAWLTTRWHG